MKKVAGRDPFGINARLRALPRIFHAQFTHVPRMASHRHNKKQRNLWSNQWCLCILYFFVFHIFTGLGATMPYAASSYASADIMPEEVYLTVTGTTTVRIDWPEYMNSGYGYLLQVKIDESGYEPVGEFSRTVTTYEYTGVKAQSVYVFRVMLRELRSGRDEEYHNEIIYRPSGAQISPSTPSLVQISPAETRISWAYSEGAAFGTEIGRRRDSETDYDVIAVAPAGVNIYIDSSVMPSTLYRYRIRAKYGYAVYSNYAEASVRSAIDTPQISEIYAASPSSVYVAWTASADASSYRIERKQKGEMEFASVTTVTNARTYYTDTGVIPGERYYYRVMAVSRNGAESLFSDEVEVSVVYIGVAQTISAIATGEYKVELAWADPGDKESTYEIWRSDEQYPGWQLLDITERNATSYIDARVGPGERYIYRIRARSAEQDSVSRFSAESFAATIFANAPSNLRQTNGRGASINLSWRDNSTNESAFYIERREGATGQWRQVAVTGANVTERAGLSAPASAAWYFRVGAYSSEHRSVAYSEPVLADNGFEIRIRSSSYWSDDDIPADAGGDNEGSGAGSAGGNADLDEIQLDSRVINELVKKGIVEAERGAIIGGGEPVTRGEFTAMLIRALDTDERVIGSFSDVRQGHTYYKEIMQAARLGFAKADAAGMFYPDRIITRAEMVVFVYDSLIANGTPLPAHGAGALRPFPDTGDVPGALLAQTRAVFGERIMIGIGLTSGRIIGIGQESTREQAALVIYRYIKWLEAY